MDNSSLLLDFSYEGKVEIRGEKLEMLMVLAKDLEAKHPSLEREDRLGQHPFAGFGTVMEDIKKKLAGGVREGQNIAQNGPRFWLWSPLETPKWVKDPGNGLKSIRGSWRDQFGGISGVLDPFRGF